MADGKSATAVEPRASGRDRAVEVMSSISLDDVLITAELKKRGQPRSHLPRAASALRLLAQQVEEGPSDVLPRFVELAPGNIAGPVPPGSAFTSREPMAPEFFAGILLTGKAAPFGGETTPRDFSPCGLCLDLAETILMDRPGRYYDWLNIPDLPVVEALLVPLFVAGRKPFGTLWLMSHDDKRFDRGDALVLNEMATLLGVALSMISDTAAKDAALERAEAAALHRSSELVALGRLAGEMAHDFNNLLAVLGGQLELIEDRVQDDRIKRLAEGGLKAAFRGEKLVQKFLSVARQKPLRLDLIDVESVFGEVVDMLGQTAGSPNVKLQIASDVWPLRADQDQLALAILNIASNARDAMMPKGGVLTIDVRNAALCNGSGDDGLDGDFVADYRFPTPAPACPRRHWLGPSSRSSRPSPTVMGTGLGLSMVCRLRQAIGRNRPHKERDRARHLGDHLSSQSDRRPGKSAQRMTLAVALSGW